MRGDLSFYPLEALSRRLDCVLMASKRHMDRSQLIPRSIIIRLQDNGALVEAARLFKLALRVAISPIKEVCLERSRIQFERALKFGLCLIAAAFGEHCNAARCMCIGETGLKLQCPVGIGDDVVNVAVGSLANKR